MKIPGLIEFNTDLNHDDIADFKVINITFTDKDASKIISELGLIREIKYFKSLFNLILDDLDFAENENVAIVSPSIKDLIFNLSILCAIQNKNVEYVNEVMYYTGPLRRNTHISDIGQKFDPIIEEDVDVFYDDEINLGDYDIDDLDD
jgi:hypothetical protein